MKTIDIRTAQNVAIGYELATTQDRFLAFFIDMIIKIFGYAVITIILDVIFMNPNGDMERFFTYTLIIFWSFLFNLFIEYKMNGQTLGKKMVGIKVVKMDGQPPILYDYLLRWSMRIVDVYSNLGVIGLMSIASTRHGQRIGDLMANTVCIKVKKKIRIGLDEILKIHTTNDYTPSYPGVKQLKEEDIVLAKQVLDRRRAHPNEAHENVEYALAAKLAEILGLDQVPNDYNLFIRTVIKDYVVLTR